MRLCRDEDVELIEAKARGRMLGVTEGLWVGFAVGLAIGAALALAATFPLWRTL